MRKINFDLSNTPTPHYLTSLKMSEDNCHFQGEVSFPSTDETISTRNHVNSAHYEFASWNVAHVWKLETGCKKILAEEIHKKFFILTRPDEELTLTASMEYLNREKTRGSYITEFFNKNNQLVAKIEVIFVAKW
jgi:hypothetical protein